VKTPITKHRKVLFSGGEIGNLNPLVEQLQADCPLIQFYQASTYDDGLQLLLSLSFDLLIAGLNNKANAALVDLALSRQVPVIIFLNGKESPEIIKHLDHLKPKASYYQTEIEEAVCQIKKVLAIQCLPRWRRLACEMARFPFSVISKMSPRQPVQNSLHNTCRFY
jgi:hypothetical protein